MSTSEKTTKDSKKSANDAEITSSHTRAFPYEPMLYSTGESSSKEEIHATSVNTNYKRGREAQNALMRGVLAVNDAVAPTIGPKGKDALLGAFEWPYSIATNDGASIAERVKCEDSYEQMGVRLIQESIGRANKESGDGSTTTCILTAAILEEGMNYEGVDFKAELNACLPTILEDLDRQTKPVAPEEVWKVAAVSAQDEEMGRLIGDIYKEIGQDGVISWEQASHAGMSYEIKPGIELRGVGFVHPFLINSSAGSPVMDPSKGDRIVVNNPKILITAEKIHNVNQLEPYVRSLQQQNINEMVVLFDEIEPMVLEEVKFKALGMNPRTGQPTTPFKIILLKAPTMWKDWVYEDLALMTGATIFGIGQGAAFKGASSLSWLGTCDKLIARRGGTDIIGTKDISEHVTKLAEASHDHREFEKRVEWLNSKSAVVKMGARSEVELTYKRLKFDDAKNAAKLALKGGIVVGGGYALTQASLSLKKGTIAVKLLVVALDAPRRQIARNANAGHTILQMQEQGIYDPAIVVKNAISAAISVAGTVLNCSTLLPYQNDR